MYTACNGGAVQAWSAWVNGPCRFYCGLGSLAQMRSCEGCHGGCSGLVSQTVACAAGSDKDWAPWASNGACDTLCGNGTQLQARTCTGCLGPCAGGSTQTGACSAGVPKAWTAGTNVSSCSAMCTPGTQQQTRTGGGCAVYCDGPAQQNVACLISTAFDWSAWQLADTSCPAACLRSRIRRREGCFGPTCAGSTTDQLPCAEGNWTAWLPVGACSLNCPDNGARAYTR